MITGACGCALTPAQCDDNYDECMLECAYAEDRLECSRTCGDEHYDCMDAADAEDARVEGTLEVLEVLLGGDDDDC